MEINLDAVIVGFLLGDIVGCLVSPLSVGACVGILVGEIEGLFVNAFEDEKEGTFVGLLLAAIDE